MARGEGRTKACEAMARGTKATRSQVAARQPTISGLSCPRHRFQTQRVSKTPACTAIDAHFSGKRRDDASTSASNPSIPFSLVTGYEEVTPPTSCRKATQRRCVSTALYRVDALL
ncbi:hypothetical protein TNCV_4417301 [Trichonephila clavipes]|nr:hypothetical protein TNCV_4417301 [Trichonephila clavipes]